ncbi:hypothetical protein RRG08_019346 [Elysia crispata]|uniref:Uncharacterized protein n=1 Tax=Elysia crispata TaxID=231223 RepID=A0AAE1EAI6_9GAST|nr:hypothetical protein RRG08_019346 [Elysia crispata]
MERQENNLDNWTITYLGSSLDGATREQPGQLTNHLPRKLLMELMERQENNLDNLTITYLGSSLDGATREQPGQLTNHLPRKLS